MSIPRSLDELLRDFNSSKILEVDVAIEGNVWAKKFVEFLEKRDWTDEVTTFKFLVLTQPLETRSSELNNNSSNAKKVKEVRKDLTRIFLQTFDLFFASESEEQVALSNAKLFEALSKAGNGLRQGHNLNDDDITLLIKARKDPEVRENGLDPKFMKFLSQQTNTRLACLLSIL